MSAQREPVCFDDFVESYSDSIGELVGFTGREHSFFLDAKVELIRFLARAALGGIAGLRLLDVGCGVGLLTSRLSEEGADVVGVDLGPGVLSAAKRITPSAEFCQYDGRSLPFRPDQFDLALVVCVLHHVPPAIRGPFLEEIARVVRPGGLLLLIEHNPLNPLTRRVVAQCELDRGVSLLGGRQSARLLARTHLAASRPQYFLLTPWTNRFWKRLEGWLGLLPIGGQYAIFGRKP